MFTEQSGAAYIEIFAAIEAAEEKFCKAITDDNARHAVREMNCEILKAVTAQLKGNS